MNFIDLKYLNYVIIAILIFSVSIIFYEVLYYRWIKKYWFFKRSHQSYVGSALFIIGFIFLAIAILDLRGPVEKAKISIPDQQTIIMVDMSQSMLAEDVRPNRLDRALIVAKHFVKKVVGHQISIVAFSETHRQIMPFSDDVELLISRLSALGSKKIKRGGSNIGKALVGAISYFSNNEKNKYLGNILIFSDFEDLGDFESPMPQGIVLGMVGIGSTEGASIPIRSNTGQFYRYKQYKGKKIITRMNIEYMYALGKEVKISKSWNVGTMDLPTQSLVNFFSENYEKRISNKEVSIRPVLGHYLIIIGGGFIALASLISIGKTFSLGLLFIVLILSTSFSFASDIQIKQYLLDRLKNGEIVAQNKLKLAEIYLKEKDYPKSLEIFREAGIVNIKNNLPSMFNYCTALMMTENKSESVDLIMVLNDLLKTDNLRESDEILNKLRKNTLLFMNMSKSKSDKGKKEKEKREKQKEKRDDNKKSSQSDKKNNKKQSKKQNDEMKNKDEKKKDSNENTDNKQKQSQQQSLRQKENKIRQQRKMVTIPTIIQQIMDQDKKHQKKYINTMIERVYKSNSRKDW